ncbi:MAG: replicative DNA helicase [Candidatus Liptonbacteria bacterium]|nr:replicative DNA helicase [Candidatus Liptonbacteria bacterium]
MPRLSKNKLKLPPQNLEAEQSVLGALLIDKTAISNVADIITAEDFYKPAHEKIYGCIVELYQKSQPIDLLSLTSLLKERDILKEVGGSSYLADLVNGVPTAAHVVHYANIVREKKVLRDLINASAQITEGAYDFSGETAEFLDEIEKRVLQISQKSIIRKFFHIKDELQSAYERIEKLHQGDGRLRGVTTGFQSLDNLTSGLQASDFIVLGARPSLGKTSLALDIARNAAKSGVPVGVFSLEMAKEQVIDRFISAESMVPLWKLRTGKITDDIDFQMIQESLDRLSRVPIFIDDTASPNILQMRSMARRMQVEHGLGLIIVDYLQLIAPRTGSESMVQQITEVSRGLKSLARELNVPILALSQLSRTVEHREVKIPQLADLRDSGSIEQDADLVLFIYRKDREAQNLPPEEQNLAEIRIAKHRNGPPGVVKLKFDPERASFKSIDTYHASEA